MTLQRLDVAADIATPPLNLVEEISHRVFNEYTEAISSLALAAAGSASRQAQEALATAAKRLRAHAETHRALLPPATCPTDLGDYIGRFCASLSNASLAEQGVRIELEVDEVWLEAERCWRVGLIMAELVRDAARHGLSGRTGAIGVLIAAQADYVTCVVGDNGCAVAAPTPGRGQRLVRSLAAELGGSVEWQFTPGGCLVRLQVPRH
jgi:two-component sensor histidine kinase